MKRGYTIPPFFIYFCIIRHCCNVTKINYVYKKVVANCIALMYFLSEIAWYVFCIANRYFFFAEIARNVFFDLSINVADSFSPYNMQTLFAFNFCANFFECKDANAWYRITCKDELFFGNSFGKSSLKKW